MKKLLSCNNPNALRLITALPPCAQADTTASTMPKAKAGRSVQTDGGSRSTIGGRVVPCGGKSVRRDWSTVVMPRMTPTRVRAARPAWRIVSPETKPEPFREGGRHRGTALHDEHAPVRTDERQRVKHRQPPKPETDGSAQEEPVERATAGPLSGGVGPCSEQRDGDQQPQEIGSGAAVMHRRPPCAHGIDGEEQGGKKCTGHRLYIGRAV